MGNQNYQVAAGFHGVAVDDARSLARDLERQAAEIGRLIKDVFAAYQEARWTGPDSDDFARQFGEFNALMLRRTKAMAEACRDFRQAAERQEKASA
jgi:uridine kinase